MLIEDHEGEIVEKSGFCQKAPRIYGSTFGAVIPLIILMYKAALYVIKPLIPDNTVFLTVNWRKNQCLQNQWEY